MYKTIELKVNFLKFVNFEVMNYSFSLLSNMTPGPVSLLSLWSNRLNTANSRKHQEFAGRLNSVNNRAELYQHLKEENGFVLFIVKVSFVNCLVTIS